MKKERKDAFSNANPVDPDHSAPTNTANDEPVGTKPKAAEAPASRRDIPKKGERIDSALNWWGTKPITKPVSAGMAVNFAEAVDASLPTQTNMTNLTESRFTSLLTGKKDALPDTGFALFVLSYTNATPRELIAHGVKHKMRTAAFEAIAGDNMDTPMWQADIGIPKAYVEDFTINQNARGKEQKVKPYGTNLVANSLQLMKAKYLVTAEITSTGEHLMRPTPELDEIVLSAWEKAFEDNDEKPDPVVKCSFASVLAALVFALLMAFGSVTDAVASEKRGYGAHFGGAFEAYAPKASRMEMFNDGWRDSLIGGEAMRSVDGVQSRNNDVISRVFGYMYKSAHEEGARRLAESWYMKASIDQVQSGNEGVIKRVAVADEIFEPFDWRASDTTLVFASIDQVQSGNEGVIYAKF